MTDSTKIVGELYLQLYAVSEELRDLKSLVKQKDERIALLDSKLKFLEKPKEINNENTQKVSER